MIERAHRRVDGLNLARQHKLGLLARNVTAKARIYPASAVNHQIAPRITIGTCAKSFMLANKIEEVAIRGRNLAALGPAGSTIAKTAFTPRLPRTLEKP